MGEHVGKALQFSSMFLVGFCIGFSYNWQLTLVLLSVLPLMAAFGAFFMSVVGDLTSGGNDEYSQAGSVAEEIFRSFRTVVSFRGETRALDKYEALLIEVQKKGTASGFMSGLGMGAFHVLMFGSYGLGLWYGSRQVISDLNKGCDGGGIDNRVYDCTTGGDVITVFWSVIIGAMAVGQAAPSLTKIAEARGAARKVFDLIERVPPIDSSSANGKVLERLKGDIEFTNIRFAYPSRPDQTIFKEFNLSVKAGNTVALVGSSGGGKSTTVALLERFYDPLEGTVSIDGEDIKNLNLRWLRQRIGLVSQEPIMFATTIKENIAFGVDGREVTMEEIEAVAKMANAHDFIKGFPEGYETFVGDKGTQLSGGQKQRIAIARAMLKDPDVLLLDEATSALDNESERTVQAALDKLLQMKRRTTIVIAHRLSTVKNADVIAVLQEGRVVEKGNHTELLELENGLYRQLVKLQETVQDAADGELGDAADLKSLFERQRSGSSAKDPSGAKPTSKVTSSAVETDDKKAVGSTDAAQAKPGRADENKDIADEGEPVPMRRLWALNHDQKGWAFVAMIAAAGNGCVTPLMGLFLSEMLVVLYDTDVDVVRKDANFWSIMFLLLGVGAFFTQFLGLFCFAHLGSTLTRRIRVLAFQSVIRQDLGFFDKPENNPGALCARLATDAHKIKAATSEQLNVIVMNITTVALSLGLAFQYSWRMTLLMIAAFPLMALGSASQILLFKDQSDQEGIAKAGKTVTEAVGGIRTVASFTMESRLVELYVGLMKVPTKKKLKVAHAAGVGQAFGQASMFFVYAGVFYFGALLVIAGDLTFDDMFRSMMLVLFAAFAMGQASTMAGDQGEARIAAKRLFRLIDQKSKIDSLSSAGGQLEAGKITGKIELVDVDFHYPERPDHAVFKKYNLTIEPNQTVALVGTSGGGKSTVISLIERFYDPVKGSVLLDGVDIKTLDVGSLRDNIGLVSQEPTLFACSIAENIAFGCGGVEKVGQDAVEEAAKKANAHDFIMVRARKSFSFLPV
jgi:ATP-binding cassette subfamily B (MDR/TAP) protein 1